MRLRIGVACGMLYSLCGPALCEQAVRVEVIFNDRYPVTGAERLAQAGIAVDLYNLDDAKRLKASLGAGLPADEKKARAIVMKRLERIGRNTLEAHITTAHQGIIAAARYGVQRYPAVLFDEGQAAVYGVTDVEKALQQYREWKTSR